jgi:hypothetical protein
MIASLDESQLELEQEYLDPDLQKRLEERLERTEDFISDLLGKLNPQQKALIAQWNNQAGDSTALWLQNRAQWTRRFEQALNNRASEQFADEITLLFVYQQQLWTDEYRQSVEENLQRGINLALAIEPTVSARQRNKLNQFLDKWIGVLAKLLL